MSTVSIPDENHVVLHTKANTNGAPADRTDNGKAQVTDGAEILSPNKTLKLTLKVAKSPPDPERQEEQDEYTDTNGQDQEQIGGTHNNQDVEIRKQPPTPTAGTSASLPVSGSHHRKPSIFGTATVEEEEQQDEADPDDAELSDAGDEPAEKDGQEIGEDNMVLVDEERAEESEAGEGDTAGTCIIPLSDSID